MRVRAGSELRHERRARRNVRVRRRRWRRGDRANIHLLGHVRAGVHVARLRRFADIDPLTLNMDIDDVISKITTHTKAVVVVHLLGYPVDMEPLLAECRKRNVKVIEDASHAHGSRYHGANVGTLADIAAFSLCGKPIAVGEGGIIVTDDRSLFERAVAWGHHFRFNADEVRDTELLRGAGLPLGGTTSRMHNISAAVGRTQLAVYPERMQEIDSAMNYFWDLMEEVPGVIAHRPPRGDRSTMGGWYCPHGIYDSASLGGLWPGALR